MHLCNERSEIKFKLRGQIEYNLRCRRWVIAEALKALNPETCTGQAVIDIATPGEKWEPYFCCDICHEHVPAVVLMETNEYGESIEICEKCSRRIMVFWPVQDTR